MKKIIYKNIVSSKIKLYIFLLLFITIVLNGINLSINYINKKITNEILNKIENRSIYVTSDESLDKLVEIKSINHVQDVYYNLPNLEVDYNGVVNYLKVFNPFIYNYDDISFLEKNEIIISKRVSENNNLKIDDEIILNYLNKPFTFKIKKIYDETDNLGNYIYISNNNEILNNFNYKNDYFVLIDNSDNYDDVIKSLKMIGCKLKFKDVKYENELLTYKDILFNLNFFFLVSYFILILCFFVILILNITEKKYSIALLKNFGYSNYNILRIVLFEHLFFIIIIYISCTLCFKLISCVLTRLGILNFFDICTIIKNFFIMIMLLISTSLILIFKIKQISLIKLLKNL